MQTPHVPVNPFGPTGPDPRSTVPVAVMVTDVPGVSVTPVSFQTEMASTLTTVVTPVW